MNEMHECLKTELNDLVEIAKSYSPVDLTSKNYKDIDRIHIIRTMFNFFIKKTFIGLMIGGAFNLYIYYVLEKTLFSFNTFLTIVIFFVLSIFLNIILYKIQIKKMKSIGMIKNKEIKNEADELSLSSYKLLKELCEKNPIIDTKIKQIIDRRNGIFLKFDYDQLSIYKMLILIDKIDKLNHIKNEKKIIVNSIYNHDSPC